MTPKEKAQQTAEKYYLLFSCRLENTIDYREAIQCALTEVKTIIEVLYSLKFLMLFSEEIEYWEQVKQELMKLE